MAKKPENNSIEDSIENSDGNVEQIREILFGGQMRDYEKRFEAIEKRLAQSIDRATASLDAKLEKLSNTVQSEVEKINDQMSAERKERASEGKDARAEFQDLRNQMDSSFVELETQLATEIKELRNALLDQQDALGAEIKAARDTASEDLKHETAQLTDSKVARKEMAALLSDIASRLTDESESSSSK